MKRRRVSIDDHDSWRRSLSPTPAEIDHEDIDLHLVENPPAQRPQRESRRILAILDQLDQEGRTR